MELQVLNFGASLVALKVPAKGRLVDVVLGFNSKEDYVSSFKQGLAPYFGAVVGRFAGRIKNARFQLNGKEIQLNANFAPHHIHGGRYGFSQQIWDVSSIDQGDEPHITFSLQSPHLEEHFPGDVSVEVTYTLTAKNELDVFYKAVSSEDTILNLTQHSYFNLDGHTESVLDQNLTIHAEQMLETDPLNVPTGSIRSLNEHAFDFSKSKAVPSQIDHAFVLDTENDLAAELYSPQTDLQMKVFTDQPCVQVYVGGKVDSGLNSKENSTYHETSGICFETQVFPDAPNHEHFPSCILKKDETYRQHTKFQFNHLT